VIFKGRFRTVRHSDHAVPSALPRPLLGPEALLDIRIWRREGRELPLLLVTTPRKSGPAVRRNQFRRRARMAFLGQADPSLLASWVVWIRPLRKGPRIDRLTLQDIEGQLRLALRRLAPTGHP
jgi:ribonuclease P protein component